MPKRVNKSAQIRELLAANWTPQQIVKKVKGAKLKDVYNVSYRLRKRHLLETTKPKAKPIAVHNLMDTIDELRNEVVERDMTGEQWVRELRGSGDESTPVTGVEITARILVENPGDFEIVEEVLECARQYGSAEITRQVKLKREV